MTKTDRSIHLCLSFILYLLGKIPTPKSVALSNVLGDLWFLCDRKHKKIVLNNLSMAYKNQIKPLKRRQLAKKVFQNTVRMLFEYAWFHTRSPKDVAEFIKIKGLHHLKKAHSKKKGVLLLTGHMGNWEVATVVTSLTGLPLSVVYRKIKSKPIDLLVKKNREAVGLKLYQLHNALDGVQEALACGDIVGLLMDQNTGHRRGVFIDFFGIPACSNPGLAKLALETGAPVVPGFSYRSGNKFVLEIQPEMPVIKTGNPKNDIILNTQNQNNVIEKIVRRYPDQWFWIHNRWKTRPLSEAQAWETES